MSKTLGLLLMVAILAVFAVPAFAQGAFSDVPADHWAYQAVDTLAKAGLVEGYPDGAFKGQRPMTRYEFAMVVARMLQSPAFKGQKGEQGEKGEPGPAGTGVGLTPEQQALLGRLQNEFMPELRKLREDVTDLQNRVSDIEAKLAAKQKITIGGSLDWRYGLYGTKLGLGGKAVKSTGYPYPGIGGYDSIEYWFSPVAWGGINIPAPSYDGNYPEVGASAYEPIEGWDFWDGGSIPISDALKDSFKAPQFMTMRSKITFDAALTGNTSAHLSILADPRGNQLHPSTDVDDIWLDPAEFAGSTSPNAYYSDGLMDSVRVDEAWMKYSGNFIRPYDITAGKLYFGFGRGLLVDNSQFPTKAGRLDVALSGDTVGDGWTYSYIGGMLDREAFYNGETALGAGLPNPPEVDDFATNSRGQDVYSVQHLSIPLFGDWKLGGTYLGTGYAAERGYSVDLTGQLFGLDVWGEWSKLSNFPCGFKETAADIPVDLDEEDTAYVFGAGWNNDSFALSGQYGKVEPLYAFTDLGCGWDPTGVAANISAGNSDLEPIGYLNLPLSLLHPVEEFNPHYINWLDRPLFLDPTNVAKGWEVNATLKRVLGDKTPISFRYYTGKAYREEYLGWLFIDGGSVNSKPSKWRDADPVWSVTVGHQFSDALSANLTYGQREVDNVMSPNNVQLTEGDVEDKPIKVLRLDLNVAF